MFVRNSIWMRITCLSLMSQLFWLLLDSINIQFGLKIQNGALDAVLCLIQYAVFVYAVKDYFQSSHIVKVWIKRLFLAGIWWSAFMLLLIPILLSFHTWMGWQL